MLKEILGFSPIDATTLAGASLWSLALYLGFSTTSDRLIEQLQLWVNSAQTASTPTKEVTNALIASILSIIPFLIAGAVCNYGVELGLGQSWAISMGIIACMGCAVYELGRRSN